MWYIIFIDLYILNHSRIPGMNSTWSWCVILLTLLVCFANIYFKTCPFFPHLRIFLFIAFRERGKGERQRERERERGKSIWERNIDWLPSCMCPKWGPNLQPRYVPWLEIKPTTFQSTGQCSNQMSHTIQDSLLIFCRVFLHLCSSGILLCSLVYLALVQGNTGLIKWVRVCYQLFIFGKNFRRSGVNLSLNVSLNVL